MLTGLQLVKKFPALMIMMITMMMIIIIIIIITYLLTHSLTYLITPWSRVLLEKLTVLQLVKNFPALMIMMMTMMIMIIITIIIITITIINVSDDSRFCSDVLKKDTDLIFFRVKQASWTTITIHQSARRHVTDDSIILILHFQSTILALEIY